MYLFFCKIWMFLPNYRKCTVKYPGARTTSEFLTTRIGKFTPYLPSQPTTLIHNNTKIYFYTGNPVRNKKSITGALPQPICRPGRSQISRQQTKLHLLLLLRNAPVPAENLNLTVPLF